MPVGNVPPASSRALAQRLLALEAAGQTATHGHAHEVVRVLEKLRLSLARFAGPDGFASLLRRALALSRAEFPALKTVTAKADGSLEGFEQIVVDDGGTDAAVAVTSHLLALLVTFVGEPLTLRLVREAWPGASLNE